ncbi:tandem-95 repeat protein [Chryseosolibacter indicus]|uniref:Tandem-95 repeat protein n=1 Tax=Chryseosolibacter indicus TaxID=2782351 RepID=A0ABS5VP85_9BACT|nr:tandem-95 repeat protein [Chryseosolibacter indicus]MBT1701821.1 tandem-95 repeat protein [Chryseosolibacter indicus]
MLSFYLKFNRVFKDRYFSLTRVVLLTLISFILSQASWAQENARNRKPRIVRQKEITINEDQAYTINLTDLFVEDRDPSDWFYPAGFTMAVYEGENYTLSGTTVIANPNFFGVLSVPVTVNDGEDNSDRFDFKITVNPVNDVPVVTGQISASTDEERPFTLGPEYLQISDPDDNQFTIILSAGANYTFSGNIITPAANFNGTLTIPVKARDAQGGESQQAFNFQLQVNPVNDPPKITGQQQVKGFSGVPLTIELSHLIVSDPDDTYPTGFSLIVMQGNNYVVNGTQIISSPTFTGELPVTVKVSDGKAESDPFSLRISIQKGSSSKPIITSQTPVIIDEDQTFTITLQHLRVSDNDSNYPQGFTLKVNPGDNYTINNNYIIVPSANYAGSLFVSVTVSDGLNTSDPYNFLITIRPINDAPAIRLSRQDSLYIKPGSGPSGIFGDITITDPDHDTLALAEIAFAKETYQPALDILTFNNTSRIRGVFDSENGILALIGKASINEYMDAFKAIKIDLAEQTEPYKVIYATVNDGLSNSNRVTRAIKLTDEIRVDLEIPTGFTPNGDNINDTWVIKPINVGIPFDDAVINVYTKAGVLVFESQGFNKEWDGHFNGTMLPADVYYYVIKFNNTENTSAVKGIITLLR